MRDRPFALAVTSGAILTLVAAITLGAYAQPTVTTDELRDAVCRHHPTDPICATATPSPSATATIPTATATPSPTPSPTPVPTPTPPTSDSCDTVQGYGATATGGANVVSAGSLATFKTALRSGNYVKITGGGVWDNNGGSITVPAGVTIDGEGSGVIFRDAWLRITSSNVIVRHVRMRSGDAEVSVDADAINLNGGTGGISRIVLDHVEGIWAPDVGGVTILNRVTDVTVQCSIIGVGLFRSAHSESGDTDGHSLAFNIAGQTGSAVPERITVHHNLITTSQGRNPQVQGAKAVDLVNNVIYNYAQPPQGNPQGANLVNNVYRSGPAPAAAGLTHDRRVWFFRGSSDHPNAYPSSVYLSGNVGDGFTMLAADAPAGVLRSTPYGTLSVTPEPTTGLLPSLLAAVGPRPIDATTAEWLNAASNRTGTYYNGAGFPAPNPHWP